MKALSHSLRALATSELRESGRFHLYGFGVWWLATRPARRIRNPATKELMWLPASVEVRFRAAKRLREAVQATQQPRHATNTTQEAR